MRRMFYNPALDQLQHLIDKKSSKGRGLQNAFIVLLSLNRIFNVLGNYRKGLLPLKTLHHEMSLRDQINVQMLMRSRQYSGICELYVDSIYIHSATQLDRVLEINTSSVFIRYHSEFACMELVGPCSYDRIDRTLRIHGDCVICYYLPIYEYEDNWVTRVRCHFEKGKLTGRMAIDKRKNGKIVTSMISCDLKLHNGGTCLWCLDGVMISEANRVSPHCTEVPSKCIVCRNNIRLLICRKCVIRICSDCFVNRFHMPIKEN